MNLRLPPADDQTDRLDGLIADYLDAVRRGTAPTPDEWVASHPDLAADLTAFLDDKSRFDQLASAVTADHPAAGVMAQVPRRIGNYEILGELGRGGMGVVYKARQTGLKRVVALKMVLDSAHQKGETLARFQAEAEAVAHLKHPNIVQIHEIGVAGGLPFFSLEFVDGGTLAQRIAGQPQPTRQSAAIVETLARAMDHAHQQGIVHRDLKPANVLMTAQGMPKITDFGLAKQVQDSDGPTRSGAILGTPCYLAPEQAAARKAVGPAADVYALGVILYEMLAGRPPFRGDTPMETLLQVMADEPQSPARINPAVPRDLETICLKCLQKDPAKRYATAASLADDLRRFRAGESIAARPAGAAERAWRWCRRRPAIAGLLGLALVLFLGGLAGIVDQWLRARAYAVEADRQRAQAQVARDHAEKLREDADALRREAQTERDRAKASFSHAQDILNDVASRLERDAGWRHPQMRELRKEFLHVLLGYYVKFAQQHVNDPKLVADVAFAHQRIGIVMLETGNVAEANKECRQAVDLYLKALAQKPDDYRTRQFLAKAWIALARAQARANEVDGTPSRAEEAFRSFGEAEKLLLALAREKPADTWVQDDLSYVYDGSGKLYADAKQPEKSFQAYLKGKNYLAGLMRAQPSALRARNLAIFLKNCAAALNEMNRIPEARRELEESRRLFVAASRGGLNDFFTNYHVVKVSADLATLLVAQGNYNAAFDALTTVQGQFRELVDQFPGAMELQAELANNLGLLAWVQIVLKKPAEALRQLEDARKILERLVRLRPEMDDARLNLVKTWVLVGQARSLLGQRAEAQAAYGEARKLCSGLVRAHPGNRVYQSELAAVEAAARQATAQP